MTMTEYETIHITPSTKAKLQEIRLYEFGEDGTMELLHPLLLTEGTRTGGYADFPNSLSTHSSE